jgi:hypothetical protein
MLRSIVFAVLGFHALASTAQANPWVNEVVPPISINNTQAMQYLRSLVITLPNDPSYDPKINFGNSYNGTITAVVISTAQSPQEFYQCIVPIPQTYPAQDPTHPINFDFQEGDFHNCDPNNGNEISGYKVKFSGSAGTLSMTYSIDRTNQDITWNLGNVNDWTNLPLNETYKYFLQKNIFSIEQGVVGPPGQAGLGKRRGFVAKKLMV